MKDVARWAILGGVGLSWLALSGGSPAAAASLTIEHTPPHLTVRIPAPTDLHTVLTAVCAQTQARCDLAAPTAAARLGPTTVSGSWMEVVVKLVAAAGLNVTAAPVLGGPGAQLVVLGPSDSGPETTAPTPPPFAGPPGIPLGFLIPPPAPRGTTLVLPFPDAQGNPVVIPVPTEPLAVLPWPGPDGQPVSVPPNPEPLTVLPIPGPEGQPLPIPPTVGTPGPARRAE